MVKILNIFSLYIERVSNVVPIHLSKCACVGDKRAANVQAVFGFKIANIKCYPILFEAHRIGCDCCNVFASGHNDSMNASNDDTRQTGAMNEMTVDGNSFSCCWLNYKTFVASLY